MPGRPPVASTGLQRRADARHAATTWAGVCPAPPVPPSPPFFPGAPLAPGAPGAPFDACTLTAATLTAEPPSSTIPYVEAEGAPGPRPTSATCWSVMPVAPLAMRASGVPEILVGVDGLNVAAHGVGLKSP